MPFESMSKEELIEEVKQLRKKLLEAQNGPDQANYVNRPVRKELSTDIEFIFDLDLLNAKGLNISDTGIAFTVEKALPVEMRFFHQGEPHYYAAELVRIKRLENGTYLMGLQFTDKVVLPDLPPEPGEESPKKII
ncbi:PilZ domain-containing protein [Dethiosulfatarculus sandiegensis]|uniref:PilZ domain-containing protein n=1 Tax=Dethiosulfatarculus sandiegensis TaxID=1429043 RepID=A0A0D2I0M9_9BACT|nr:PilZ domain-containing protein [Dethiosulfatarculus sandiegensis]KIX16008.1 hypothetical protein X474_00110 [Dethiosulfatarculus sandiegensis]